LHISNPSHMKVVTQTICLATLSVSNLDDIQQCCQITKNLQLFTALYLWCKKTRLVCFFI